MLSPDNFVLNPGYAQNFNRYSYAYNNPLKYTDPTGDYALVDDLTAAAIGGVFNLGMAIFNGSFDGMGFAEALGKGAASFAAGAAAGTLSLYGPLGWAAGGAITGATNAWVGGAPSGALLNAAGVGAFSGLIGGAAGQYAAGASGVVINGFRVTSPVLKGMIGGAIGGAAGGYAGGFAGSYIANGDVNIALQAGYSGMVTGLALGATAGSVSAYAKAVDSKIDPWSGKPKNSIVIGENQIARVEPIAKELGAETIKNDWTDHSFNKDPLQGKQFNAKWMEVKIQKDYYIYDIGPKNQQIQSKFYRMEAAKSLNYSRTYKVYHVQQIKTIRILIIYK
jgi:hypothetical protein